MVDGQVAGVNGPSFRITADHSSLQGFEVIHSPGGVDAAGLDAIFSAFPVARIGVLAENADDFTLVCNILHDNSYGALILADGTGLGGVADYDVRVLGNEAYSNSTGGVRLDAQGASGSFTADISGNQFTDNMGSGLSLNLDGFDVVTASVNSNDLSRNTASGMLFTLGAIAQSVQVQIDDNTASGNSGGAGLQLQETGTAGGHVNVESNRNS